MPGNQGWKSGPFASEADWCQRFGLVDDLLPTPAQLARILADVKDDPRGQLEVRRVLTLRISLHQKLVGPPDGSVRR